VRLEEHAIKKHARPAQILKHTFRASFSPRCLPPPFNDLCIARSAWTSRFRTSTPSCSTSTR
jgi:predicted nucleic acid-binding protein